MAPRMCVSLLTVLALDLRRTGLRCGNKVGPRGNDLVCVSPGLKANDLNAMPSSGWTGEAAGDLAAAGGTGERNRRGDWWSKSRRGERPRDFGGGGE